LLPFSKKDQSISGALMQKRHPDQKPQENQDDSSAGIEACAQEIIDAVEAKDAKRVAEALKDAFELLDNDDEAPEPHSYDSQKTGEE